MELVLHHGSGSPGDWLLKGSSWQPSQAPWDPTVFPYPLPSSLLFCHSLPLSTQA